MNRISHSVAKAQGALFSVAAIRATFAGGGLTGACAGGRFGTAVLRGPLTRAPQPVELRGDVIAPLVKRHLYEVVMEWTAPQKTKPPR